MKPRSNYALSSITPVKKATTCNCDAPFTCVHTHLAFALAFPFGDSDHNRNARDFRLKPLKQHIRFLREHRTAGNNTARLQRKSAQKKIKKNTTTTIATYPTASILEVVLARATI